MKSMILIFILQTVGWMAWAGEPPAKKSQFNTQVYEQDSSATAFSAIVKVVREVHGETEVFFEGKQGFYTLQNPSLQERLMKSQRKKKSVSVEVDNARVILKVEIKDE
mgnify:CR=1 FL=1